MPPLIVKIVELPQPTLVVQSNKVALCYKLVFTTLGEILSSAARNNFIGDNFVG